MGVPSLQFLTVKAESSHLCNLEKTVLRNKCDKEYKCKAQHGGACPVGMAEHAQSFHTGQVEAGH